MESCDQLLKCVTLHLDYTKFTPLTYALFLDIMQLTVGLESLHFPIFLLNVVNAKTEHGDGH